MFKTQKESQQRFSIRKYAFGATSILLGTFFAVSGQAYANEVNAVSGTSTQPSNVTTQPESDSSSVVANTSTTSQPNNTVGTPATSEKKEDTVTTAPQPAGDSSVNPASTPTTENNTETTSSDKEVKEEKPMNVFSLDAGRKYFTPAELKSTIDKVANLGYTDFHLLLGNNGLRLVLDDMSLDVNGKNYTSETVKEAIKKGNQVYEASKNYRGVNGAALTQTEMDDIAKHVKDKKMRLIPTINSPGHMNAIVTALGELGVENAAFTNNGKKSAGTIDLNNQQAVDITKALVDKYAKYFADKSEVFNIGLDEYANDSTRPKLGFKILQEKGEYSKFVTYANDLAAIVKKHGLKPMAFNDGIYHGNVTDQGTFDKDIIVSYWTIGFPVTEGGETERYVVATPQLLHEKGHKIINTNDDWYYVIGRNTQYGGWYNLKQGKDGIERTPYNKLQGAALGEIPVLGAMVAVWADDPARTYDLAKVNELATAFANKNASVFKADYSELEKLVALLPKDSTGLDQDKYRQAKEAIDDIDWNKTRDIQADVDNYVKSIKPKILNILPDNKIPTEYLDLKIFSLDAGRKYFSPDTLKQVINKLSELGYTDFHLLLGNDGLRFFLDDMTVTTSTKTYDSNAVKEALKNGNNTYYNDPNGNHLTEAELTDVIKYAKEKRIRVIPTINSPGHMDAILEGMIELGINNPKYTYNGNISKRTVDLDNQEAVDFTKALIKKYITYFADKSSIFNIGLDEYANDATNARGFERLIKDKKYGKFVEYANDLSRMIKEVGMKPMAFSDGVYYNSNASFGTFDKDLIISYWTVGWNGYTPAKVEYLRNKGHHIINTHDSWYYVLGRTDKQQYNFDSSLKGIEKTPFNLIPQKSWDRIAPGAVPLVGSMIAVWADEPEHAFDYDKFVQVVTAFADKNPDFLKANYNGILDKEKSVKEEIAKNYFTEESVKKVVDLIKSTDWDKVRSQQGDVDAHLAELTKAIEALVYKKADYSKLEQVTNEIPEDLEKYWAPSTFKLEEVLNEIDYDLNIKQQAEVDVYVEKLKEAVSELVKIVQEIPEEAPTVEVKPEIIIESKVPEEAPTVEAKPEITIESKVPEEAPTVEAKPEITIESKVPEVAPTVEVKPEIIIESKVPEVAPTVEAKPEITIESKVPEVAPTAEVKPEIIIESKVPEVAPTVEAKPEIIIETAKSLKDLTYDLPELDINLLTKKQEINSESVAQEDVTKKPADEKVLPKTSVATNKSETSLPLGLATALVAVGLLTRRNRKEV